MRAPKAFYELHKPEKMEPKGKSPEIKKTHEIIKEKHSGAKYLKTNKLPKDLP